MRCLQTRHGNDVRGIYSGAGPDPTLKSRVSANSGLSESIDVRLCIVLTTTSDREACNLHIRAVREITGARNGVDRASRPLRRLGGRRYSNGAGGE